MAVLTSCITHTRFDMTSSKVRVTLIQDFPYFQQDGDNNCHRGLIPDLLRKVAEMTDLNFELRPVKDGRYGAKQQDGTWSGMIGELIRDEADLAASALAVTTQRSQVVDFTTPFRSAGLVIVYKTPNPDSKLPFSSAEELVRSNIPFGCIRHGATWTAFETSHDALFKRMWSHLRAHQDDIAMNSAQNGITKVLQGNFAMILEEDMAKKFVCQHHKELEIIGKPFLNRNYGFAVRMRSPLRDVISSALIEITENGELDALSDKWWSTHLHM